MAASVKRARPIQIGPFGLSQIQAMWGTEDGALTRSQDHYLIVYAQYYENANQFILFKVRKPAWTAPITVPHTLSIGMVNLARPTLISHDVKKPIILDPFCGTGTTLIDTTIRLLMLLCTGVRQNPLMPRLVKDNLQFFSFGPNPIHDLINEMSDFATRCRRGWMVFRMSMLMWRRIQCAITREFQFRESGRWQSNGRGRVSSKRQGMHTRIPSCHR